MIEKMTLGLAVLLLILVGLLTSSCVQDAVIPAWIEADARQFVGGYKPVNGLYTSLYDLDRIERMVEHKVEITNEELVNAIDHNFMVGKHHLGGIDFSRANAQEIKETVFNPNNGLGLLLTGAPMFALGWLGLSKPSDKKKLNGGS